MSKQIKVKKEMALTLVPAPLKGNQLLSILQKTPANHIYHRPGKGGGEFDYVTGTYIKKVLNYTFGWMWDFEVKEHGKEGKAVWVLGKLTIKNKSGKAMIVKEQFGRADIKEKKAGGDLDFGNDLKAAATDALKKCASELGIASDVYGKQEFKDIQNSDKGFIPPKEENAKGTINNTDLNGKTKELKSMLKGNTDEEKLADLKKRTSLVLRSFEITEKHAGILVASLLNSEVK